MVCEEEPFLARGRHVYLVAFGLEPVAKGLGDLPLVLHDQHPHGGQGYRGLPSTAPDTAPSARCRDSMTAIRSRRSRSSTVRTGGSCSRASPTNLCVIFITLPHTRHG